MVKYPKLTNEVGYLMSSKIINNAFLFFSIVFFFVLMHVPFPTQELRLTDWALPSNLVAFSFAGILCSIGLFSIFIKKTIDFLSRIIYNITCVEELTKHQHREQKNMRL